MFRWNYDCCRFLFIALRSFPLVAAIPTHLFPTRTRVQLRIPKTATFSSTFLAFDWDAPRPYQERLWQIVGCANRKRSSKFRLPGMRAFVRTGWYAWSGGLIFNGQRLCRNMTKRDLFLCHVTSCSISHLQICSNLFQLLGLLKKKTL